MQPRTRDHRVLAAARPAVHLLDRVRAPFANRKHRDKPRRVQQPRAHRGDRIQRSHQRRIGHPQFDAVRLAARQHRQQHKIQSVVPLLAPAEGLAQFVFVERVGVG
ncbi:MAG: hypothetical protein ACK56I_20405, partial [bacterium]